MPEKKRRSPLEFIGSVKVELASVKWPNRQETIRLTLMVIIITACVSLYIGGLDVIFTTIIQNIIK